MKCLFADFDGVADALGSGSPRNGDDIFLFVCKGHRKGDDCGMDLCCYQRCCLCGSFKHNGYINLKFYFSLNSFLTLIVSYDLVTFFRKNLLGHKKLV